MKIYPKLLLKKLFHQAIRAAQPGAIQVEKEMEAALSNILLQLLAKAPPNHKEGITGPRLIVLGAGKASAAMAASVEKVVNKLVEKQIKKKINLEGLVITQYGYKAPCQDIEVVEAAHPVPDKVGLENSKRILKIAQSAQKDDLVLFLISGGGSSLLTFPAKTISLLDKQNINRLLLESGASIDEINCVRKHLSAIKGGRLARAAGPAKIVTLLISDVPGDEPSVIASGPTVPDPTTSKDALNILKSYKIKLPNNVYQWLSSSSSESPKPKDPSFKNNLVRIIATPQNSLAAAAKLAEMYGVKPYILSEALEGEAEEVGIVLSAIAKQISRRAEPFSPPCVLLSGGETTVTIKKRSESNKKKQPKGRGGRNVHFLLSLLIALNGEKGVYALAGDTDGIDGTEKVAGAIITPATLSQAKKLGIDLKKELDRSNAHYCFELLKSQIITGPTYTNVNDFRAILVTH